MLPGVGAFAACMKALKERGFDRLVTRASRAPERRCSAFVSECKCCLKSRRSLARRLDWVCYGVSVRKFGNDLVVPQVGWNRIHQTRPHALFEGIADGSFCYFVHSFYCEPEDERLAGETEYGGRYASVVAEGNICGVQFHPEKSQDIGTATC